MSLFGKVLWMLPAALAAYGCGAVRSAWAQVPYLDPLPGLARADTSSGRALIFQYDRFDDEATGWSADRFGLTGLVAAGLRSRFFVRAHYLSFDTGQLDLLERWPQLAGEVPEGWPGEHRLVGWTRPDVGLLGDLRASAVGEIEYGLAVGLPIGRDELYPLTAASMPVRLFLGKWVTLSGPWRTRLGLGRIWHLDSGRDLLQPGAFPSGAILDGALSWQPATRRSATLFWHEEFLDGHRSTRAGCQIWWPYAGEHALGLCWQRELAGRVDRPFASLLTLSWYLHANAAAEPAPRTP
jgi:hypothetical protein